MAQFSQSRRPRYTTGKSRKRARTTRAPRSRTTGPAPARRKKPTVIIIVVGVIIAVIFCWIIGRGCGGSEEAEENDRLRAYTTEVNKLIERSGALATQFHNLRNGITELTRDDVSRMLEQMASDCGDVAEDAKKVDVPSKAETLHPLLQLSLDLRTGGVADFQTGILDVLDNKDVEAAANSMSEGLIDLVVSDESMERFRSDLENQMKEAESGDLGFVQVAESPRFVPKADDALLSGVTSYISELEGTDTGDEVHGVAVTGVTTSPASQDSTSSGVSILPYSTSFTVTVAVENQGNQEEEDVPVIVTLVDEKDASQQQQTKKITRLKPNETVTLVFDEINPVTGRDTVNILTVKAGPVENEKNVENNEQEFSFLMLPEGE